MDHRCVRGRGIPVKDALPLHPVADAVFDLVLLDDKNPRSVLFQVNQLAKHFRHLPQERESAPDSGKNLISECAARLNRTDARELATKPEAWPASDLSRTIRQTLRDLPKVSDAIAANYFAHSAISRTGRGSDQ